MESKLITINVEYEANKRESVYLTRFHIDSGYSKLTSIAAINIGEHKKFDFGLNDHNNNVKLDLADISFWKPSQMAKDRMMPVNIPISGNFLQILTNIRASEASKISYQVIAKIEK